MSAHEIIKGTQVHQVEWIIECKCGWMKRVGGTSEAAEAEGRMHVYENTPRPAPPDADDALDEACRRVFRKYGNRLDLFFKDVEKSVKGGGR